MQTYIYNPQPHVCCRVCHIDEQHGHEHTHSMYSWVLVCFVVKIHLTYFQLKTHRFGFLGCKSVKVCANLFCWFDVLRFQGSVVSLIQLAIMCTLSACTVGIIHINRVLMLSFNIG